MSNTVTRRTVPELDNKLSEHALLHRIYASRGILSEHQLNYKTSALLHVSGLKGIELAAQRIGQAIIANQRIIIIGDFDADGATSTALCILVLSSFGAKHVDYLVPNRFDFGYGLSPEIVDLAAERGNDLIITVDNGISSLAGVERANQLSMDVVVTDHHLAGDSLPNAYAIVNPNQPGCEFQSKALAGVGVAFYVLSATRRWLLEQQWFSEQAISAPNLANYLDLVALGTVADVVPLDHNNRILVHQGLQRIRAQKCRPGIVALLTVGKRQAAGLQASDLGFVVGPRLNAAGRLEDMSLGIECLLTDDPQTAQLMATELDQLNQQRRQIEADMQIQAEAIIDSLSLSQDSLGQDNFPLGLVLHQADWHQGVIGIVAGRIKEKHYRPTIAFAMQDERTLKGSARSIPGIHIRDVLEVVNAKNPGLIDKFGGHAMAAGLSLKSAHLAVFERAFQLALDSISDAAVFTQHTITDGVLTSEHMSLQTAEQIQAAGPWGQQFPAPIFDGEFSLVQQRIVGEKHLKVVVATPDGRQIDGIAFNVDTALWPVAGCPPVALVYSVEVNEFRQQRKVQLLIQEIHLLKSPSADLANG